MNSARWIPGWVILFLACGSPIQEPTSTAFTPNTLSHPAKPLPKTSAPLVPSMDLGEEQADQQEPSSVATDERSFSEPLAELEDTRALVLMYHAFDKGPVDLSVDGWQFDRQLSWLRANGVEIVATSEIIRFLRGEMRLPQRVAVVTIDDGDKSVHRVAWPILKKHQARFTLALPTKLMNENRKHRMLSWEQVREMVDSGLCEIGSHGHEHKSIIYFSSEQARRQLEASRDILEKETGQRPVAFFYPLGSFDERTAAIVQDVGYEAAFKATGAPVGLGCCSSYEIPRVGIVHRDTVWSLGWYYSSAFLGRMVRTGSSS